MDTVRPIPARPVCARPNAAAAQVRYSCGGAPMSFDHPLALLLALLPLVWAAWEWRSSARRLALLLKAGAFAAIALALAAPRLNVYESKVAVAMLADTSSSISAKDLQAESAFADKLERA